MKIRVCLIVLAGFFGAGWVWADDTDRVGVPDLSGVDTAEIQKAREALADDPYRPL